MVFWLAWGRVHRDSVPVVVGLFHSKAVLKARRIGLYVGKPGKVTELVAARLCCFPMLLLL